MNLSSTSFLIVSSSLQRRFVAHGFISINLQYVPLFYFWLSLQQFNDIFSSFLEQQSIDLGSDYWSSFYQSSSVSFILSFFIYKVVVLDLIVTTIQEMCLPRYCLRLQQYILGDIILFDCLFVPYRYFGLPPGMNKIVGFKGLIRRQYVIVPSHVSNQIRQIK